MTGTLDDWRPTRTSTALVVLASVGTAAVLARAADVVAPAVVGGLGAVTLAGVVWASDWERSRAGGTLLASLLTLPVGLGIAATTVGTVLVLAGSLFPVPAVADVPSTVVLLVARAMVVVGATAAVFGAVTATRGVLDRPTLQRATKTAIRTAVVPFLLWAVLAVRALLRFLESNSAGPGPGSVVGDVVGVVDDLFFHPAPLGPHLPTFVLLVGLALLATQRGVQALPVTELLAETEAGRERRETVERVEGVLFLAGAGVLALFPVATVVHLALPPGDLRGVLGAGVYDFVAGITTAPELRSLAWWVTLLGAAVAGAVWLLRRVVQTAADRIGSALAPFAGGTVIAVATVAYAEHLLSAGVEWTAGQLPGQFGTEFTALAEALREVYGAGTLVLGAVTATVVLAACAVGALWLVLAVRYVEARTAGSTIASLALFNAAAFTGVLDVSNGLVLGALVAAVLVWDAGEFGVTLGQEVGRRASTRRAELVHSTGTLAVGGVGGGVAWLISEHAFTGIDLGTGPVAFGLLIGLAGLLALVVALR